MKWLPGKVCRVLSGEPNASNRDSPDSRSISSSFQGNGNSMEMVTCRRPGDCFVDEYAAYFTGPAASGGFRICRWTEAEPMLRKYAVAPASRPAVCCVTTVPKELGFEKAAQVLSLSSSQASHLKMESAGGSNGR
jgi:hypothetical protein